MELLNGDQATSTPGDFPFLGTGNLLVSVSGPTAAIHSPDDGISFPPQKLRPIRAPCSSPTIAGGEIDQFGGEVSEYFDSPEKTEDADVAVHGGRAECAVVGICSGADGEIGDLNWVEGLSKGESSSSLDDSDDDADNFSMGIKDSSCRKRKRRERKKLENFLESLAAKVMEKQEQMHKQLIEMIESRERERVIREEAWKQQEIERMKRDDEMRAQETARNLALISFIQNVMAHGHGHGIEAPKPLTTIPPMMDNVPIQNDFNCNPGSRRWPEAEVQALITVRTAVQQQFQVMGSKSPNIWETVSAGMHNLGYNRTAKKCKEKWENINRYLKKSLESRVCPYFNELDVVSRSGLAETDAFSKDTVNEMKPTLLAEKYEKTLSPV